MCAVLGFSLPCAARLHPVVWPIVAPLRPIFSVRDVHELVGQAMVRLEGYSVLDARCCPQRSPWSLAHSCVPRLLAGPPLCADPEARCHFCSGLGPEASLSNQALETDTPETHRAHSHVSISVLRAILRLARFDSRCTFRGVTTPLSCKTHAKVVPKVYIRSGA